MQRYEGETPLEDIKFERTTLWVQVHGILTKYMNIGAAKKIYGVVGDVFRQSDPRLFDGGNFIRVQVSIDVSLPLCRGRLVSLNNQTEVWVTFKYERLPNIYYWCGRLTFNDRDCDLWIESEGTLRVDQREFGPNLRAPPFIASKRNVITVLGYYAARKNASSKTTMVGPSSGQSHRQRSPTEPKHPQAETESNVNTINSPLRCNVNFGINSSEVTDTISPNPINSMIDEAIKSPNSFGKVLNDIDEELCRIGEVGLNEVAPGSRANLSESGASPLNKSRASQFFPVMLPQS